MSSWASPFSLVQALLPLCSAIGFERVSIVVLSERDPERREAGKAPCLLPRDHTPRGQLRREMESVGGSDECHIPI